MSSASTAASWMIDPASVSCIVRLVRTNSTTPELVLDFLDLMADRRRRQPELVGRAREIEMAGGRVERSSARAFLESESSL